ncbi:flavonol sulfotransferase-like [Coffea eugenioides]|uniref:flavonol sulfotransferase-like n=1 Tax=Coffea eugenioides TaxID=49369 RepID=UPI000F60DCA5|nr:flavonol sulfotransferase-like [Coffea eugenioides]
MAIPSLTQNSSSYIEGGDEQTLFNKEKEDDSDQILSVLPRERGWLSEHFHLYQGFWCPTRVLKGLLILQKHFRAQPSDILLATYPKSGTTWLKALLFSITNRTCISHPDQNPLLTANPHELVPMLESYAAENPVNPKPPNSLMHTHIPYNSLPESTKSSGCPIVYVYRDPKDVLVSCWHFVNKLKPEAVPRISLAEAFEKFSKGASPFGPYWNHVLGYWKASIEWPERVFFLRYEDLKKEPCFHTKRLAEFLGQPFTTDKEGESLVSKVVEFCSFKNLSNLDVNKTGSHSVVGFRVIENKIYFREGQVGDSQNYLEREMMDHLDQVTEESFKKFHLKAFSSEDDEKSEVSTAM